MCTNLQLRVQLPFFTGFPFHPPFPDKKLRNTEEPISNYSKEQLKSMIWKSKIKMIFLKLSLRACNQNTACLSNKANAPLRASSSLRDFVVEKTEGKIHPKPFYHEDARTRGYAKSLSTVTTIPPDTQIMPMHPFVLLRAFETSR